MRRVATPALAVVLAAPAASIASTGALDPSFGTGGVARFDLAVRADPSRPARSEGHAAALQGGGLVIAGFSGDQSGPNWLLVTRVDEGGRLDPSFGDGGVTRTAVGCGSDFANAIAVQPDGKILVAGGGSCYGNAYACCAELARYTPDGRLDSSYGQPKPGHPAGTTIQDDVGLLTSIASHGDGAVAAGQTHEKGGYVERMDGSGRRDPAFGDAGVRYLHVDDTTVVSAVATQADGRIVVTGTAYPSYPKTGPQGAFVVRLLRDGTLDPSFGSGGVTRPPSDDALAMTGHAIAVQPDGRIVIAGARPTQPFGDPMLVLWRLLPDGRPDGSFGSGGRVEPLGGYSSAADAITVLDNGELLVAGSDRPREDVAAHPMVLWLAPDGQVRAEGAGVGAGWFAAAAADAGGRVWAGGTGPVPEGQGSPGDTGVEAARFEGDGAIVAAQGSAASSRASSGAASLSPAGSSPTRAPPTAGVRRRCIVPDVRGRTLAAARRILRRRHCAIGRVRRASARRRARGPVIVVAQRPAPRRRLHPGRHVSLVVRRRLR